MANPTLDDVREFLREKTGTPASSITLDTDLADLGLESKDIAAVISRLESKFGVKLDTANFENVKTVGDFYRRSLGRQN